MRYFECRSQGFEDSLEVGCKSQRSLQESQGSLQGHFLIEGFFYLSDCQSSYYSTFYLYLIVFITVVIKCSNVHYFVCILVSLPECKYLKLLKYISICTQQLFSKCFLNEVRTVVLSMLQLSNRLKVIIFFSFYHKTFPSTVKLKEQTNKHPYRVNSY